ncbi:hypothetical protein BH09ACT13_BH09ACT13_12750 [soil metagenome]
MKGIGIFVALLLAGLGVATYLVTRPPDRELDTEGRAWVSQYQAWAAKTERQVTRARVEMTFSSEARNVDLIEPLRNCAYSFALLGPPPEVLETVAEAANAACGRAEFAVQVNERFGTASLATTKLHLGEAEDRLTLSRRNLRVSLGESDAASG